MAVPAAAQDIDPGAIKLEVEQAAPGVFVIYGAGGNIGLAFGEDGAFLIDDQFAPLGPKIMAKVEEIAGRKVRFLLNTHWHGDHTGGNENFGKSGTLIFAQDNVRKRLSTEQHRPGGETTPPSPEGALPIVTFGTTESFHINGDTITATHVPHAHTDGDALVKFEKANVLHMGDTFFNSATFPFIDLASGGSIKGAIAAVDKGLALSDSNTKIIPGHGRMADRAALERYRAMLADIAGKIEKLLAAGKTREEIVAAKPAAAYAEGRTDGFISADEFVGAVYDSLTQPPHDHAAAEAHSH